MKTLLLLFSLFAAIFILGACNLTPRTTPVAESERDAVLAFADPKTDGLLAGFNAGDYAAYSHDFDTTMRNALPEPSFIQTRQLVTGKIGKYVSRKVDRVERIGEYVAVVYSATFEQEEGVTVRVVFTPADDHLITGLFFTSPKLRE
ncbi:MAG: DUF3887 domain-containing protein [Rudaea sp.]